LFAKLVGDEPQHGGLWSRNGATRSRLPHEPFQPQALTTAYAHVRLICTRHLSAETVRRAHRAAQVGRRLTRVTILAGSIVRVWGSLERVLERAQGMLSRSDRTMRVVRADFGADGTLIGAPSPGRRPAARLPAPMPAGPPRCHSSSMKMQRGLFGCA